MTKTEFLRFHVDSIMACKSADAKKRELAVLLFQYLLTFKTKAVEFHIDHVAQYSGLEPSFLNQPHDTYKNPSYAAPLMDMFGLSHILMDENKYQSLLESSLLLLMNSDVNPFPRKYLCYRILSSIRKSDKDDEFFASEFIIDFSEDFWNELNNTK